MSSYKRVLKLWLTRTPYCINVYCTFTVLDNFVHNKDSMISCEHSNREYMVVLRGFISHRMKISLEVARPQRKLRILQEMHWRISWSSVVADFPILLEWGNPSRGRTMGGGCGLWERRERWGSRQILIQPGQFNIKPDPTFHYSWPLFSTGWGGGGYQEEGWTKHSKL